MPRSRKLPSNVVKFKKGAQRSLPRATTFRGNSRYFYRETPPPGVFLIFEYIYTYEPNSLLYAGGIYLNGKPEFHNATLHNDLVAGQIKLLSWRQESEWRAG